MPTDIVNCARRYSQFYNVDGIFVDEMGPPVGGASVADVTNFYQSVYDGVKGINASWWIIGNPGAAAGESLVRNGTAGGTDTLVTFEGPASAYAAATLANYAVKYPASRFANILFETKMGFDFGMTLKTAAARRVGYI